MPWSIGAAAAIVAAGAEGDDVVEGNGGGQDARAAESARANMGTGTSSSSPTMTPGETTAGDLGGARWRLLQW